MSPSIKELTSTDLIQFGTTLKLSPGGAKWLNNDRHYEEGEGFHGGDILIYNFDPYSNSPNMMVLETAGGGSVNVPTDVDLFEEMILPDWVREEQSD